MAAIAFKYWRHLFAATLLPLFVACAAIPAQEMSDARQAIQAAKEVGAQEFAAGELGNAERLMQQAEEDLNMGFYGRAQKKAAQAKRQAMAAHNKAVTAVKTSN